MGEEITTKDPVNAQRQWQDAEELAVSALQSLCDSRDAAMAEPLVAHPEDPVPTAVPDSVAGRAR